jgi:hypothetical protein
MSWMIPSPWQARHLLEPQHQPKGDHGLVDVSAIGSRRKLLGNMAPCIQFPALGRQMMHKLAHVGERREAQEFFAFVNDA